MAGEVTAGLAESNGSLPPGGWLTVTFRLTASGPNTWYRVWESLYLYLLHTRWTQRALACTRHHCLRATVWQSSHGCHWYQWQNHTALAHPQFGTDYQISDEYQTVGVLHIVCNCKLAELVSTLFSKQTANLTVLCSWWRAIYIVNAVKHLCYLWCIGTLYCFDWLSE